LVERMTIIFVGLFFLLAYEIEQNLRNLVLVEIDSWYVKRVLQMKLLELLRLPDINQNVRSTFGIILRVQTRFDLILRNYRIFGDIQILALNLGLSFCSFN
jgi:hypothetical protein